MANFGTPITMVPLFLALGVTGPPPRAIPDAIRATSLRRERTGWSVVCRPGGATSKGEVMDCVTSLQVHAGHVTLPTDRSPHARPAFLASTQSPHRGLILAPCCRALR